MSEGNKGVLHIPPSSHINGASPSDYLVSYPRHSLRESHPSAEMQSVYFAAQADWVGLFVEVLSLSGDAVGIFNSPSRLDPIER